MVNSKGGQWYCYLSCHQVELLDTALNVALRKPSSLNALLGDFPNILHTHTLKMSISWGHPVHTLSYQVCVCRHIRQCVTRGGSL